MLDLVTVRFLLSYSTRPLQFFGLIGGLETHITNNLMGQPNARQAFLDGANALAQDPALPLLLYAAAGQGGPQGVNHFDQVYTGRLTTSGTVPESFRVITYDVTQPGKPQAAG